VSFQVKGAEFCKEEYKINKKCPDLKSCHFDMIRSESSISVTLECEDKRCLKITEKISLCSSPLPLFFKIPFRMYFSTFKSVEGELLQGTKVTKENSVPASFIISTYCDGQSYENPFPETSVNAFVQSFT